MLALERVVGDARLLGYVPETEYGEEDCGQDAPRWFACVMCVCVRVCVCVPVCVCISFTILSVYMYVHLTVYVYVSMYTHK